MNAYSRLVIEQIAKGNKKSHYDDLIALDFHFFYGNPCDMDIKAIIKWLIQKVDKKDLGVLVAECHYNTEVKPNISNKLYKALMKFYNDEKFIDNVLKEIK